MSVSLCAVFAITMLRVRYLFSVFIIAKKKTAFAFYATISIQKVATQKIYLQRVIITDMIYFCSFWVYVYKWAIVYILCYLI